MKILAAVGIGVFCYLPFLLGWYGTLPHESSIADFAPYVGFAVVGLAVGKIEPQRFLLAATLSAVLLPPLTGLVHWGACHFNTRLDVCGLSAIMTLEMMMLPASVGICVLSAWLGTKWRS